MCSRRYGITAILIALIGAANALSFEIPPPEVSLAASAGIISGNAKEFVYANDDTLSELVWPLDPVYTLGLDTRLVWRKKLGIAVNLTMGLPRDAGTLTDTDFLNVTVNGSDAKTDYSEHDARLNHLVLIDLAASWTYWLPVRGPASKTSITVTPSIGFRYFSLKWTGSDGYGQYTYGLSDWSESLPKTKFSGSVIEYRQRYIAPLAGIAVNLPVGAHVAVEAAVTGSPAVWCDGTDSHVLKKTDYHDYLSGGILLEPRARVSWAPEPTVNIFADCAWTRIVNLRGPTEKTDLTTGTTTSYSEKNGGGAEYTAWTMKLGVKKTFKAAKSSRAHEREEA